VDNGCYAGGSWSYQPLRNPANEARDTRRITEEAILTPGLGTNGTRKRIPLPRDFQENMPRKPTELAELLRDPLAPLAIYAGAVAFAALAAITLLTLNGFTLEAPWLVLILAISAAAAERGTVRLSSSIEVSVGLIPSLFAAVVLGPLAALVVSAASMLGDLFQAKDVPLRHLRWVVYTGSRSVTGAITGLVAVHSDHLLQNRLAAILIATLLGALASEVLDLFFVSITLRLRGNRASGVMREVAPVIFSSLPLFVPLVAFLAYAYEEFSPLTLPLFLVPAFAAQRLSILYQDQRRLAEDLAAANANLERANLSFATALVATLDARDRYTAGHSAAVAVYARDIAARMGLSEEDQQLAHLAGLVHDIGKVGLLPGLLEKPGPLTLAERRQMEEHSAIGERILRNVEDYREVAGIVRHHHERVDGEGYPDKISGTEIPLIARIITVADAYNAMTSDRPYRDAMPTRVARLRLAQAVESQFDTSVVAAFEAILATQTEAYRTAADDQFDFARQESSDIAVRVRGAA
jgi:putative nucleotidyltransferase with HDIG domain